MASVRLIEVVSSRRAAMGAIAVASVLFASTGASAGILYTVRTNDRMLRAFDTTTLSFTNIGPLGQPFDFGDLAYDHSTGTMYMVQGFAGRSLFTVNLTTGAATSVGAHGFTDMFGLAYVPRTDTLYGSRSTTGTGFYSIDRDTGAATSISNPGVNLDALTYDSRRDMLIGAYAGPGDLYEIDPESGGATLLFDGPFFNNCGMAYDPDTDLIWMIDWSGDMLTFDPDKGYQRTTVLTGLGAHDGLASTVIPAPAGLALLGLSIVAYSRRRRA